ncbi:MAG: recombinase family protein [Clostridiales bacterium]|nr:recombinase family protein [Clostridiales bacterium]
MYGYARVSTRNQREDRQLIALREFGVAAERIVVEKQSGKNFDRPLYRELVLTLCPGDVLVVKSIDRLGRNYEEISEQWGSLTKEKRVAIVVLDMLLLDTREGRDLTGTLVSDIVLQLHCHINGDITVCQGAAKAVRHTLLPIYKVSSSEGQITSVIKLCWSFSK